MEPDDERLLGLVALGMVRLVCVDAPGRPNGRRFYLEAAGEDVTTQLTNLRERGWRMNINAEGSELLGKAREFLLHRVTGSIHERKDDEDRSDG